jgi:hypothetical protein
MLEYTEISMAVRQSYPRIFILSWADRQSDAFVKLRSNCPTRHNFNC